MRDTAGDDGESDHESKTHQSSRSATALGDYIRIGYLGLVDWEGLRTKRLWLRPWRDGDLDAFASMNADPEVMEHFPAPLSRDESAASMARYRAQFDGHGFCFWAVELRADSRFVGALGLSIPRFVAHFTPCVEIGWRLAREHWGRGYATEGAKAALRDGFARLGLKEIVAFTVPPNLRSRRVMEKLAMRRSVEDDFDHPLLALEHPLRRHLLYRLSRADWELNFPGSSPR